MLDKMRLSSWCAGRWAREASAMVIGAGEAGPWPLHDADAAMRQCGNAGVRWRGQLSDVVVIHHTEVVAKVHRTEPGDPVRYDVDFSHKPFL